MIVGTLPPPRFVTQDFKLGDVDFCYGSIDGLLWKVLDEAFSLQLSYETTVKAIEQRKNFLQKYKIGICDIVSSAKRKKIDASDLGMYDAELRPIVSILRENPSIETLLLMGGNSKNGPEYFLRKHLKTHQISLILENEAHPKEHFFKLSDHRNIRVVSLISPSGAANMAIGSMQEYKELKNKNPKFNTFDFRVKQYATYFS
ncbi:hypothetical protein GCM10009117_22930 [Gangjinia marincola]|uniref:DNA glycosylase n=1 Tax=Gangjinia marincola TaxID=578463 RepID=A0ABN1MIW0_9FLAO